MTMDACSLPECGREFTDNLHADIADIRAAHAEDDTDIVDWVNECMFPVGSCRHPISTSIGLVGCVSCKLDGRVR
jgi:hypothetical protein